MKNVSPSPISREELEDDDIPVGRILSRREAMLHLASLSLAGITVVLTGCGGGTGSGTSALGSASNLTGRAVLVITWPTVTSSRLIPTAANSIVVSFSSSGTVIATQTVARPTTGTTSTVTFGSLPPGALSVTATAYPSTDGTGTAQATATTTATIVSSQTTTVNITMASTIDHLTITPTSPTVSVGGTTTLAVAAYDSSGSVVLTSASNISWTSSDTTVATVGSSTGLVTGIKAGTATITVKESESGKTATTSVTVTSSSVSCVAFPQETEGPYWVDVSLNRSDVRSGNTTDNGANTSTGVQKGIPLTLTVYLVNVTSACAAISGAQIDIWQCNTNGIYSAEAVESTSTQKFLRGYQTTDSSGKVVFTTIYPGWYSGRTTHIHFRVRFTSGSKSYNLTGQLFFDETLTASVYKTSDYSSRGQKDTANASDMVYNSPTSGAGSTTLLSLSGSTSAGYTASFTMGVSI